MAKPAGGWRPLNLNAYAKQLAARPRLEGYMASSSEMETSSTEQEREALRRRERHTPGRRERQRQRRERAREAAAATERTNHVVDARPRETAAQERRQLEVQGGAGQSSTQRPKEHVEWNGLEQR